MLMEGSLVETQSMLAAGTVLPPGRLVPTGELWAGNPAKFVRKLTNDEVSPCLRLSPSLVEASTHVREVPGDH